MAWNVHHLVFVILRRAAALQILDIKSLIANHLAVNCLAMADQLVHANGFADFLFKPSIVFIDFRNLNLLGLWLGIL